MSRVPINRGDRTQTETPEKLHKEKQPRARREGGHR